MYEPFSDFTGFSIKYTSMGAPLHRIWERRWQEPANSCGVLVSRNRSPPNGGIVEMPSQPLLIADRRSAVFA